MWYLESENKVFNLHSEIRSYFKNVSFTENITEEDIAFVGLHKVEIAPKPEYNPYTHKIEMQVVKENSVFKTSYQLTQMTTEEQTAYRKSLVPEVVFMRQARLALLEAGLLNNVNQVIASLLEPMKTEVSIEWEYATEVRRDWPTLLQIVQYMGLTEESVDNLFISASKK